MSAAVQSRLRTVPITLAVANAFVGTFHRHHGETVGHKISTGVVDEDGELRGVAIMEYPKARRIDRTQIVEVTRVATDECPNACSALYGATCRMGKAHGFQKAITYTLLSEPGTSLRAAGWRPVSTTAGGSWSREGRARTDKHPTEPKIRWECQCSTEPTIPLPHSVSTQEER